MIALGLVPWSIWLTSVLPSHERAEHWDVAWGGFDLMLAAALLGTAVCAWRNSPLLEPFASSAATLLVVDAWFDLLTSGGHNLVYAVMLAVAAELPLTIVCVWIVHDGETFVRTLAAWRRSSSHGSSAPVVTCPGAERATPRRSSAAR